MDTLFFIFTVMWSARLLFFFLYTSIVYILFMHLTNVHLQCLSQNVRALGITVMHWGSQYNMHNATA